MSGFMAKKWVVVYDDQNIIWYNSFHVFRWMAEIGLYLTRKRHAATMLAKHFYIGAVSKDESDGIVIRVQMSEGRKDA